MFKSKFPNLRPAISNIAWDIKEEKAIAQLMQNLGVKDVEVAPGKIGNVEDLTASKLAEYRKFWEDFGISIVAMQALLFARPNFALFGPSSGRQEMSDYLKRILEIGAALGVKAFVFGSPKNRLRGQLDKAAAMDIALPFFKELGDFANQLGTALCIEANPVEYGCDFITNSADAIELVQAVASPGFGFHLDLGVILFNGQNPEQAFLDYGKHAKHCHLSIEQLAPIQDHPSISWASTLANLSKGGYSGPISIEMRGQPDNNQSRVEGALKTIITALTEA